MTDTLQGFLTAVQQDITRSHKADNWTLDNVVIHTEVTEISNIESIKLRPKEGAYIHGLFLDGASWSKAEASLTESSPKKLFSAMPIVLITAVTKVNRY